MSTLNNRVSTSFQLAVFHNSVFGTHFSLEGVNFADRWEFAKAVQNLEYSLIRYRMLEKVVYRELTISKTKNIINRIGSKILKYVYLENFLPRVGYFETIFRS